MKGVHTMAKEDDDIAKLEEQVEELADQLEKATAAAAEAGTEATEALTAQVTELTEKLAKAEETNAELLLKASMTQDEKDHCSNKSAEDTSAFMAKPADERKATMKKAADGDEVIKVEGQEIRKSVVGDAQFNIFKAQDARIKKQDEDIAKERDKREMAELSKRADDEFPHVPGDVKERAEMLKAINAMEEPLRKSFEAVFTASEKLAKGAFDTVGNRGGVDDLNKRRKANGISDFEKKVEEIHKSSKNMTRDQAMSKARVDFPDDFKKYQEDGKAN